MRRCLFGLAVGLLLVPANTQASSILVNGGFELGPAMDGPLCPISPAACQDVDVVAGLGVIPGWDVFGDSIDYLGPPWNVSDGFHAVDLDGRDALFSGVSQTFATKVGKEYDVFFDLSGNPQGDPLEKTVRVTVDGFSQNYSFDSSGQSINGFVWDSIAFSFVASGSSATLAFLSLTGFPNSYGPLIDKVRVVPEPTALLLLGGGLFAAGYRMRRRKQR